MEFSEEQVLRYSRNMVLAEVGPEGQARLLRSSALIVGAGGLGSPAALYLAAAGVGRIGILDSDRVDLSNLQRQILHDMSSVGRDKTDSAVVRLRALNPGMEVRPIRARLEAENALELVRAYDFVVDGSDNFPTKFLVNDACVLARKPFSHAGVLGFRGQALTVVPGSGGPCLRCLMPELPPRDETPTCSQSGVLGAAVGVLGSLQAVEALKVLLGVGKPLVGRLLTFDALGMTFRVVEARRDPRCALCGEHPVITSLDNVNYA